MRHHDLLSESSFQTTDWGVISQLDSPQFAEAMAALCQQYWYPVYAFIRRKSGDATRAEDLTQSFFARVLAKNVFRAANPEKGRFRAFLLTSVKNFLATELAQSQTQKRGGKVKTMTFDFAGADHLFDRNLWTFASPEEAFDRAWAITLMEGAIDQLRGEYTAKDQDQHFELLAPILQSLPLDYSAIASQLNISQPAARKMASRFREQLRFQLRKSVAATLSESDGLDDEIAWMMSLFAR